MGPLVLTAILVLQEREGDQRFSGWSGAAGGPLFVTRPHEEDPDIHSMHDVART